MPALDEVIDAIRDAAGADFAFVLTQRGRLVTKNAPRDMPEIGRAKLVAAAQGLTTPGGVGEVTLPRVELVRFGGAAPVDIFVALASQQAIVCVVMSSWADKRPVLPAIEAGLLDLDALLTDAAQARGKPATKPKAAAKGKKESSAPPAKKESSAPPAKKATPAAKAKRAGSLTGLVELGGAAAKAAPALKRPPTITVSNSPPVGYSRPMESLPDIVVGTATLGRESLAAVERESQGPPSPGAASSMPDIRVELVSIGRETGLDLRQEEAKRMQSLADAPSPDPLVASAAHRMTQPWAEAPVDAKRAADAARRGRRLAPPKVTLKLEEPDDDVLEALLIDGDVLDAEGMSSAPPPIGADDKTAPPDPDAPRPPKSSLEVWHEAIEEATSPGRTLPVPQKK